MSNNRAEIIEILQNDSLLSARDICIKLPYVDRSTVYRNLAKLEDEGIIRSAGVIKGKTAYEISGKSEHIHTVCNECGKIKHIEINEDEMKSFLHLKDFDIEKIEIKISGRCKRSD